MSDKKYIRFIDSDYNTLFHLPDGGHIRITHSDGKQFDRVCHYIDEYHTTIGKNHYHICEFAERMEAIDATYEPLDYIRELEFYTKHFFLADGKSKTPAYFIIDETKTHGFAFAPKGAAKGKKYCVFERVPNGNRFCPGKVVQWGGSLRESCPQDWGFNMKKIKAIVSKPKTRSQPGR